MFGAEELNERPDVYMQRELNALSVENRRLRKELEEAHELIAKLREHVARQARELSKH